MKMFRMYRLAIALIAGISFLGTARADVTLQFEWIGSGQVFAPTDPVPMKAKVTNFGGDDLTGASASGSWTPWLVPSWFSSTGVGDNYVEDAMIKFGPVTVAPTWSFSIPAGGSVVFTMATWLPSLYPGNFGDPARIGTYVVPASALSLIYSQLPPATSARYSVDLDQAGNFQWTVQDKDTGPGGQVPLPATALLLALGLMLLYVGRAARAVYLPDRRI